MKPGIAILPVILRLFGSAFSRARHCFSLRPSFQRIAGRNGLSDASSRVAPCICPLSPTDFTARRALAGNAFTAACVAVHQSAGSCSDQPGCGRDTVSAAEACSTTASSSSTRTALTLEVPISMPRYIRASYGNRVSCWRRGRLVHCHDRTFRSCGPPAKPKGRTNFAPETRDRERVIFDRAVKRSDRLDHVRMGYGAWPLEILMITVP